MKILTESPTEYLSRSISPPKTMKILRQFSKKSNLNQTIIVFSVPKMDGCFEWMGKDSFLLQKRKKSLSCTCFRCLRFLFFSASHWISGAFHRLIHQKQSFTCFQGHIAEMCFIFVLKRKERQRKLFREFVFLPHSETFTAVRHHIFRPIQQQPRRERSFSRSLPVKPFPRFSTKQLLKFKKMKSS